MDTKVGLIITLVVGIIMVGSLVAPLVSDYTTATYTYTNEGMPFAAADDDTHTITVDSEGAITVDGTTIDLALFPGTFTKYTIVYSDSAYVRYDTSAVTIQTRLSGSAGVSYDWEDGVTITINGTSATVANDTTSSSTTISDVTYYIATEGDYVMALNPCVTSESIIYGAGNTYFGASAWSIPTAFNVYCTWKGTIEEITNTLLYYTASSTYTVTPGDVTVNTTEVDGDLVRIDSILLEFDATTSSDVTYSPYATYTYFLAPAEVTYDNPDYIGSGAAAVMGALVVMTILVLLLAAVRHIGRND